MQVNAPDLPIHNHRDEIEAALASHQVLVVCGETGSGKTTQLPAICLNAGRLAIGHTQPRRIAARAVARRLAEELGTEVGQGVGFKVRFSDRTGPNTRIKVMTDGILLQEIRRDRRLRAYDTLIIDEAHERSTNIDFLLGYLKGILPRRPELRLIITSATIDPQRFAKPCERVFVAPQALQRHAPVEMSPGRIRFESRGLFEMRQSFLGAPQVL